MKKKKLKLNKETIKNLTLEDKDLADVVGGRVGPINLTVFYTGGSTNWCPNTGSTCHSCGASCIACPGMTGASVTINPQP